MRTVNFRPDRNDFWKLAQKPRAKLMRTYRNVIFTEYGHWQTLSVLELELLKNVENLKFKGCGFSDANEFVWILKHCKELKSVYTESYMFEDFKSAPIEKFQNPVSLSIQKPLCESLDCFEKVSQIHVRCWMGWYQCKSSVNQFLSSYTAAITSIVIHNGYGSDDFLRLLVNTPQLKLKHLEFYPRFETSRRVMQIVQILAHHKSFLTNLSLGISFMEQSIFDAIRLNLVNLEKLAIPVREEHHIICLSDLKVLTKLTSLSVSLDGFKDGYELDVSEFLSLEQLKLHNNGEAKVYFKRPNMTLKNLYLEFKINRLLLAQIPTMFPNLRSLHLYEYYVSILRVSLSQTRGLDFF
jgi:hypothetical protein